MGLVVVRVLQDDPEVPTPYERRYLGRITAVQDGVAMLSDSDVAELPLAACYLEGTRTNVEVVGRALLGAGYDAFSDDHRQTYSVTGAEPQVQRLSTLGIWLERKSPLQCCAGLDIRVHKTPHKCPRGTDAGYSHVFNTPIAFFVREDRSLFHGLSISRSTNTGHTMPSRFQTNG
jgi:hypothetical protein